MPRNSGTTRDSANSQSQARTERLTEARHLIIHTQHLGIESSASLLTLQHAIERALRSERRARRRRGYGDEERVTEIEESVGATSNSECPGEEDMSVADEVEATEPVDTSNSVNDEPTGGIRVSNLTGHFLEIIGPTSWQVQDWDEALHLLGLDPSITPHWPSNDFEDATLVPTSIESIESIIRALREDTPEPEGVQEISSTEVS